MTDDSTSPTHFTASEQCMLYLSGDLSPAQSREFESHLASSPDLADELRRQSELICIAGDICTTDSQPVSVPYSIHTTVRFWQTFAAIAACLALLLGWFVYQSSEVKQTAATSPAAISPAATTAEIIAEQEEVLIARTWATTATEIHFWQDESGIDIDQESFPKSVVDDSSLSWITSAIESGVSIDG